MSEWSLPKTVEVFDKEYKIRNKCDYRVILDVIEALNDEQEEQDYRIHCAMFIFFENPEELPDPLTANTAEEISIIQEVMNEITKIINCGKIDNDDESKPKMMDWQHDFGNIAAPVSRVLGYSVRDSKNYTHWYDFVGAYGEIGDCYWSQIMNIRSKKIKGKRLDENDREFYKEHKKDVDLPMQLSNEEQEWLESDW